MPGTQDSTALRELAHAFGGTHLITLDGTRWTAAPRGGGDTLRRASADGLKLALHLGFRGAR